MGRKVTFNDYESIPSPAECASAVVVYSSIADDALEHTEMANGDSARASSGSGVYSDPWDSKTNVCAYFEKIKLHKIHKSGIR